MSERRWGHRFCGAYLDELVQGQWFWIAWHDVERVEGQCPSKGDAILALDHFLAGRRRAGKAIGRLAEALPDSSFDVHEPCFAVQEP